MLFTLSRYCQYILPQLDIGTDSLVVTSISSRRFIGRNRVNSSRIDLLLLFAISTSSEQLQDSSTTVGTHSWRWPVIVRVLCAVDRRIEDVDGIASTKLADEWCRSGEDANYGRRSSGRRRMGRRSSTRFDLAEIARIDGEASRMR